MLLSYTMWNVTYKQIPQTLDEASSSSSHSHQESNPASLIFSSQGQTEVKKLEEKKVTMGRE